MKKTIRRLIATAVMFAFLLGNSVVAFAGSSVRVHIDPKNSDVVGVSVSLDMDDGTTLVLECTGGENSGTWSAPDDDLYITDLLVEVTITFKNGKTLEITHKVGQEGGGTLNIWLEDIVTPKIPLTVTANSLTTTYNGELQEVTGYEVSGGLLSSHELSDITASGSGTNVGSYPVTFSGTPVITDGDGEDVTRYYEIQLVHGELIINPTELELTVQANSDTKVYTGLEQTVSGY